MNIGWYVIIGFLKQWSISVSASEIQYESGSSEEIGESLIHFIF